MKITLAQQNYHIKFQHNVAKSLRNKTGKTTRRRAGDIFRLCICGYPRDFLEFNGSSINVTSRSIASKRMPTLSALSLARRTESYAEEDLFNAAWLLYEKEVKASLIKPFCLPMMF
jgi:NAD+ synthase (glutamine-hydrolysing)